MTLLCKVLGNLGTLGGESRKRPGAGGKEGQHGEGVVGKRREERKRGKDKLGDDEVEIKTKRVKRKEVDPDGERIRKVKSAKRREQGTGKRAGMKSRYAFTIKKNASCGHFSFFRSGFSPFNVSYNDVALVLQFGMGRTVILWT